MANYPSSNNNLFNNNNIKLHLCMNLPGLKFTSLLIKRDRGKILIEPEIFYLKHSVKNSEIGNNSIILFWLYPSTKKVIIGFQNARNQRYLLVSSDS